MAQVNAKAEAADARAEAAALFGSAQDEVVVGHFVRADGRKTPVYYKRIALGSFTADKIVERGVMRAAIYSRRPQGGAWSRRAFLKKARRDFLSID